MLSRLTNYGDMQVKWLFIPVEVKVRELQAKTLLACLAAERGFNVVLGEAHAVRDSLHQLPAGVLLEKGVAPSKEEAFARFRALGNLIVSWCEEGLVFLNDEDYVRRKVSQQDLEEVELFFAWGQYHAGVICDSFPSMKDRVVASGNPRLDLLRLEFRDVFNAAAQELRSRFGRFILVNTNFSHCNHKKGEGAYVDLLRKSGKITTQEEEEFAENWMIHKRRLFDAFFPMIDRVRESFPDYKVIVRPHPGENHETWKTLFKDETNIVVLNEGGVIPWIMASSVLIHNGCTTGIEAALLDHPAIAYRPVISETYDQYLPNSVNYQADNEEQLIKSLDLLLNQKEINSFVKNPEWHTTLNQYLSGFNGDSACDIILDHVEKIHKNIVPANRRIWYPLHRLNLRLYMKAYTFLNKLLVGDKDRGLYSMQKFPSLDLIELEEEIIRLKQVSGKISSITSRCLVENVFLISKVQS